MLIGWSNGLAQLRLSPQLDPEWQQPLELLVRRLREMRQDVQRHGGVIIPLEKWRGVRLGTEMSISFFRLRCEIKVWTMSRACELVKEFGYL